MARGKNFRTRLNKRKVARLTREQLLKNMLVATVVLRDAVKVKMNRGQPTRTTPGGAIIGLDPSQPDEPPKKVTGQLQNSVRNAVVTTRTEVVGLVGTDLKKAAALEFGNRKGTLKPRPAFRPALREQRARLLNILARGVSAA